MTIDKLTCEYLRNPLGIDVPQPRLSWMLRSDQRGQVQTAYQILVASSKESLAAGKADLWDSGRVQSDRSIHVCYAGRQPASGECCWWKLRVWDRDGKPSRWSKPASWTMGLLSSGDWKGKWISNSAELPTLDDTLAGKAPAPLVRKAFRITKPVKRATAYTCGLGFFELHLNGKKVGAEVLQPCFTRYDKRALYITDDVTSSLKPGENAVGAILGNGWFNSQVRDAWDFDKTPWRATPRMLFQMVIEYTDGTSDTIVSDSTWKTSSGPIIFDCMRNGEAYDARREKIGWDTAGHSETGWKPVVVVDGPTTRLVSQKTAPVRVTRVIKPVKITEPKPGVYLLDFGQNLAGWGRLSVSGPAGTTITIKYDERINDDGSINQADAGLVYSGKFQTDTYVLKGEGVEVWEPHFSYAGFQYAQVEGFPGKLTKDSLQACVVQTDFEDAGKFECSNDLLNRIQRAAKWAYVSNFLGYPTDCPHREKNGWTGDAQLACEMGLYNFSSAAIYSRWIDDFDDAMAENGDLPGIVPTGGWGYGVGPAWDSAYLLIPYYLYLYCGDERILTSHYAGFKRYVDYLGTRSEGNIVQYGLGDWCPPVGEAGDAKSPRELTSTAYYYVDALIVARTARLMDNAADAKKYSDLAAAIKKAFNAKFYDSARGVYAGECQTSQCTPLYQGLAEPGEETKIVAVLLDQIEKSGGHLDCGILGTKYLLHALTDRGRTDVAYQIATKKTFPSWGKWIEQGATTLWESWNGGGSHNHIMFGDISAWFYKALAGINPDPGHPGFKHIIIRPRPVGDLKWARAEHISMYGPIRSSWSMQGDKFTLKIDIPANTTATVYVPASDPTGVTEGGAPLAEATGIRFTGVREGCAVLEVASGKYEFSVAP